MSEARTDPSTHEMLWHQTLLEVWKENDLRLVSYVPDNVLKPLIEGVHADPFFTVVPAAREEEAVGIVSGAALAGMNGVVLMQTSGLATLANVLASLPVVYNIPVLMVISERGVLGEFNRGQALVARTARPLLDAAGVDHYTVTRRDELRFIADRGIRQALSTRVPAAFMLSPLLTGGKTSGVGK